MKIDGRNILARLSRDKSDRKRVTLYLSKKVYEDFSGSCGDIAASQVIEELMRQFTQSVQGRTASRK